MHVEGKYMELGEEISENCKPNNSQELHRVERYSRFDQLKWSVLPGYSPREVSRDLKVFLS